MEQIETFVLEKELLKQNYINCNFQQELILDSFINKQNMLKAAKSHGIVTSISAGVGANQSAQLFPQLFTSPSQRQNISINTSIPLTGRGTFERNKEIAKLEFQNFENNKMAIYNNAEVWAQELINSYSFLIKSYSIGTNKITSLQLLAASQMEKVMAGKTNATEYNNTMSQIQSGQVEQFQLVKKIILFKFELREATLYDISLQKLVY